MNGRTHKNKRGGAFFTKKAATPDEVAAHNNLPPDIKIGVLVSEKSLASNDSSIRGNPYVIILPEAFKEGDERYAYGSSAADAVSRAQQGQYQAARFPDDTYTGVGISSRNLVTKHPEMAKQPYVIQYEKEGQDKPVVEYGTSPAFIKRSSIYAATRRIAGKVGNAAAYGARGIGSTLSRGRTAIGAAGSAAGSAAGRFGSAAGRFGTAVGRFGSNTLSRGRSAVGTAVGRLRRKPTPSAGFTAANPGLRQRTAADYAAFGPATPPPPNGPSPRQRVAGTAQPQIPPHERGNGMPNLERLPPE